MPAGSATDPINVACCFDRNMELPFLILAHSIKKHLGGARRVVLHAFHSDPLGSNEVFRRGLSADVFDLRFIPVQNEYERVHVTRFPTAATYIRLMLPALLPEVGRVLYLDSDLLLLRDIMELHDADLGDRVAGVVPDYSLTGIFPAQGWEVGDASRLWSAEQYVTEVVGLSDWRDYFNSGVMLIDLDEFRRRDLGAAVDDFVEQTEGRRLFNEQDVLNHVLNGATTRLDPRWNVHAPRTPREFERGDAGLRRVGNLWHSDPWLIHYCGLGKPWDAITPRTLFDGRFWREAGGTGVLPLLLEGYLGSCERANLTALFSRESLLASGKPALTRGQILAHAHKFAAMPEVAAADRRVIESLDVPQQPDDARPAALTASLFKHAGGILRDGSLVFDLATAQGNIVFGPYASLPTGAYEARFEFSLPPGEGDAGSSLMIDIADDTRDVRARWFLPVAGGVSTPALVFESTGNDLCFEFRIFASGFQRGTLSFSGVSFRKAGCPGDRTHFLEGSHAGLLSIPVFEFAHHGGSPRGRALAFDLSKAKGHLIFGPHPAPGPGNYEAFFDVSFLSCAGDARRRLAIEVTDEAGNFLAHKFLSPTEAISPDLTLPFRTTGKETFLEYRIFADGFTAGTLLFSGVTLRRPSAALKKFKFRWIPRLHH